MPVRRIDILQDRWAAEGLLMSGLNCPGCIDVLWDLVRPHLAAGDLERLEARFRAGAAEHGDDWTTWPDDRFDDEVAQELDDVLLYRAMQRAARVIRDGAA